MISPPEFTRNGLQNSIYSIPESALSLIPITHSPSHSLFLPSFFVLDWFETSLSFLRFTFFFQIHLFLSTFIGTMPFISNVLATLLAASQLFLFAYGHVEMKSPIPFRSKFLVPQPANADFSMTSPLNQDGSNFPCKGYQNDDLAPTATLTAGQSFQLE